VAKNGISLLNGHVLSQAYFFRVTANTPVTRADAQEIKQQSFYVLYAQQS
jgi:hypothetical protein